LGNATESARTAPAFTVIPDATGARGVNWPLAMLLIPAVLLMGSWSWQQLRVWLVMMGAWVMGMLAVTATGDYTPVLLYIVIDICAAFLVLIKPAGIAQKLIGCTFAMMISWHVGFSLAERGDALLYTQFQSVLGWAQWAILMLWGLGDAGKAVGIYPWGGGVTATDKAVDGAGRK